ncbi:MAG: trypsin-like peptidase domain-containing protein [Ktedonobacteraceae bacterium]
MQFPRKSRAVPVWLRKSPGVLCIIGCICLSVFGCMGGGSQVFAAMAESTPGGHIADPVVRQVDIARPAVVRIITKLGARLTVQFTQTSQGVTFPLGGGNYPLELSGSGAFISAHGDILTADHVVNPPHDQSITDFLYQTAASDIADYINAHLRVNQPATSSDVVAELEAGVFTSTPAYDQASSEVYLSTAYAGPMSGTKLKDVPAKIHAAVDRIEAQSSFDAMDVAIIHVTGMDNMPSIQLDDSSQVAEQDKLTVIGFPGLGDVSVAPINLLTSSINTLYVSALKTTDANAPLIQVGGNIEHGDSGGPVLDDSGHIVGIVSFGLFNPNETGSTTFLQAANSARTLIQAQSINTTPGAFQHAWAQAFNDYASTSAGHWHTAFRELQDLVDNYPGFLGAAPYLAYAQSQTSTEQPATTPSTPGSNPTSMIVLSLLGVLVVLILGAVVFVVMKRRSQAVPAGAAQGFGAYAHPQSGMPGAYVPPQPNYPPMLGSTSGTYPPVPASYNSAWYEQATSAVPQTPQPAFDATPMPVATIAPRKITKPLVHLPFSTQDGAVVQTERPSMPTWAPLPHTPQPDVLAESTTMVPMDEPAAASQPVVVPAASEIPQNETLSVLGQSSSSARNFSVPRRPVTFSQEAGSSGVHTWVAPCGHTNTPEVRFCRVCGQPVQEHNAEASEL